MCLIGDDFRIGDLPERALSVGEERLGGGIEACGCLEWLRFLLLEEDGSSIRSQGCARISSDCPSFGWLFGGSIGAFGRDTLPAVSIGRAAADLTLSALTPPDLLRFRRLSLLVSLRAEL